ncbi:hypothetical protein ASPWEDRAFT_347015 [Aspergillus wentii DTO 134E9]|uniref:Uncharacterized protein n=1 Tax=Aspergillus wentii DTO 134E9 TaxID=1073089 RepID=A0A1L9RVG6_ASPWE|nr:uncharacterized protein ASPWEDRAFT_347015 [Aspergillus wentii DTO 134E9]OJJ38919.1 hypothetical protein ASPWEDRAFT_347015 [Aspergillus wentii DTO 134E9]
MIPLSSDGKGMFLAFLGSESLQHICLLQALQAVCTSDDTRPLVGDVSGEGHLPLSVLRGSRRLDIANGMLI